MPPPCVPHPPPPPPPCIPPPQPPPPWCMPPPGRSLEESSLCALSSTQTPSSLGISLGTLAALASSARASFGAMRAITISAALATRAAPRIHHSTRLGLEARLGPSRFPE